MTSPLCTSEQRSGEINPDPEFSPPEFPVEFTDQLSPPRAMTQQKEVECAEEPAEEKCTTSCKVEPRKTFPTNKEALKALGHSNFRDGQQDIIERVLQNKDTVAVMQTNGGKSLCFQLPALRKEGLTIVFSPLIALMKDQVANFNAAMKRSNLSLRAECLSSKNSSSENAEILKRVNQGEVPLLYVAPERFRSDFIITTKVYMMVVDEAHCYPAWKTCFRPDYAKLRDYRKELKADVLLAVTGSTTNETLSQIINLGQGKVEVVRTAFNRDNLVLHQITTDQPAQKFPLLLDAITKSDRPGAKIVFVLTRVLAEEIARRLGETLNLVKFYHAGMTAEERDTAQDWFMKEESPILVATSAFGMGVDRRSVGSVYLYGTPNALETAFQQIGRAGRDGNPSDCYILTCDSDKHTNMSLIKPEVSKGETRLVLRQLFIYGGGVFRKPKPDSELEWELKSKSELKSKPDLEYHVYPPIVGHSVNLPDTSVSAILNVLESRGYISSLNRLPWGRRYKVKRLIQDDDILKATEDIYAEFEESAQNRKKDYDEVVRWANSPICLMQGILRHHGEEVDECGRCSNCTGKSIHDRHNLPTNPNNGQQNFIHKFRRQNTTSQSSNTGYTPNRNFSSKISLPLAQIPNPSSSVRLFSTHIACTKKASNVPNYAKLAARVIQHAKIRL